jgi:hypothetical protein
MQVVLVMFRNDGERRSFSVVRNMTIIGRREDCDLRIPVSDVSRKHCRLVRTDDGIRIEDLGSSNGTYVNGERIQEGDLHAGDVLGIGPVQFTVQIDGVPHDEELEPPTAARPARPAPPPPPVPAEEPTQELAELEDLRPDQSFIIEDEPATEPEEAPMLELDEPATEEYTPQQVENDSLTLPPESAGVDHLADDELHPEELVAEEPSAQADATVPPQPPQVQAEVLPLDDFEELQLDDALPESPAAESPAAAQPEAPSAETVPASSPVSAAAPVEHEIEELDFEQDPLELDSTTQSAAVEPPAISSEDHLEGELELDEAALVESTEETPAADPVVPATEAPAAQIEAASADTAPLELSPTTPAYDEVRIEAGPDEIEELSLDEAPATNGEASESSWDFVIEESDNTRSHHDFKLDLDSPHEQTHG